MSDFSPGDRVRYLPGHAFGNQNHEDCEDGIVRSTSGDIAFVVYDNDIRGVMSTLELASGWTSAPTKFSDLVILLPADRSST